MEFLKRIRLGKDFHFPLKMSMLIVRSTKADCSQRGLSGLCAHRQLLSPPEHG